MLTIKFCLVLFATFMANPARIVQSQPTEALLIESNSNAESKKDDTNAGASQIGDIDPATVILTKQLSERDILESNLNLYFDPICESTNDISTKQLSSIQTQFENFNDQAHLYLARCMIDHMSLDLTSNPLDINGLTSICQIRQKHGLRAFVECLSTHEPQDLIKGLEQIITARRDCNANHKHEPDLASGKVAPGLLFEEHDDKAVINDMVSQMLHTGNKHIIDNPEVKVIDLNATSSSSAGNNVVVDPNTLLVLVDDSAKDKKQEEPAKGPIVADAIVVDSQDIKQSQPSESLIALPVTTAKPSLEVVVSSPTKSAETINPTELRISTDSIQTSSKPVLLVPLVAQVPPTPAQAPVVVVEASKDSSLSTTTPAPAVVVVVGPQTSSAPTTAGPSTTGSSVVVELATSGSTKAPAQATGNGQTTVEVASKGVTVTAGGDAGSATTTTTTAAPKISVKVTNSGPSTATSAKPQATSVSIQVLKASTTSTAAPKNPSGEKIKVSISNEKLSGSGDVRRALEALAKQKQASSHGSPHDLRMHQLEHDRQMIIDPVGHTLKHQAYELKKQKKMASAAAAAAAAATAKQR